MNKLLPVVVSMLGTVVTSITPELRERIVVAVKDLDERAKKTPNPMDNMAVALLKAVLDIS